MSSHRFKDIRRGHDDLSQEEKSDDLSRSWPMAADDRGASTSGINCLTVLLKQVYSNILEPLWNKDDESVKRMEADNPFMAHAWLVFPLLRRGAAAAAAVDQLADRVWGKALGDIAPEDLQFKCLASHARMQTTLWSMSQFNLMLEHLWWQQDSRRWRQLQHEATPTEVKDYFAKWNPAPTPDSVRLDAFPGMSLDVEVNKLFGEFSVGDFTVLVRPDAPLFFYATFTVKDVGQEKLDFNAFRRFNLEVGKFVDVDGTMRWRRTGSKPYTLAALVKHRNSVDECDTIRVYDHLGINNIPHRRLPGYAATSWKMADMENGDTFLALFVYSRMPPESDPPFPEVFKPDGLAEYMDVARKTSAFLKQGRERKRKGSEQ
ncbi:hypothetical protein MAJ_05374, partial [Metarhizium majus ARSEF 297]